jgi:seryl-tRNA(Sec) selenium transferase
MNNVTFINQYSQEVAMYFGMKARKPRIRAVKEHIARFEKKAELGGLTAADLRMWTRMKEILKELQEVTVI